MVTGTELADPEGRLADEAAAQPEWNLPTWEDIVGAPAVVLCGARLSNQSGFSSVFEGNPDWFA